MNLQFALDQNNYYSGKASDTGRTLALAAIAIAWLFKETVSDGSIKLPVELVWVGFFAVAALTLDFLQYAWGTFIWWVVHRSRELELGSNSEDSFEVSVWVNRPTFFFFWAKLASVALAYVTLLTFLVSHLRTR